jgi:hypothetical protein
LHPHVAVTSLYFIIKTTMKNLIAFFAALALALNGYAQSNGSSADTPMPNGNNNSNGTYPSGDKNNTNPDGTIKNQEHSPTSNPNGSNPIGSLNNTKGGSSTGEIKTDINPTPQDPADGKDNMAVNQNDISDTRVHPTDTPHKGDKHKKNHRKTIRVRVTKTPK